MFDFLKCFGSGLINHKGAHAGFIKAERSPEMSKYLIEMTTLKRQRRRERNLYLISCGGFRG